MVAIPDALVERLNAGEAVLVAGLGCGELAGAPGWPAILETLRAGLTAPDVRGAVAKLTESGRLTDATLLLRDSLSEETIRDVMREAFPVGATVAPAVAGMARLPWRAVITTAFDDVWERALAEGGGGGGRALRVLVGSADPAELRAHAPGMPLMHLFGRAAVPDTIRLGAAIGGATRLAPGGLTWLADLRRRRSLVLVGFRPGDPDLTWLLSWMSLTDVEDGLNERPHFLFLDVSSESDPQTEARLVALRTGMTVIPCGAGTSEAAERLAHLSAVVPAELPPSDAEVDLDQWLDRWAKDRSNPEPREVLSRAAAALRADHQWDRLVELLLRRLDLLDDREEQLASLREIGEIFRGPLKAPHRALLADVAALRLAPTDDAIWASVYADAAAAQAWEQLTQEAADVARAAGATPAAARIWREIGRIARRELGRSEEALEAYAHALVADPAHPATRSEQADLLRELGRWQELVAVLRAAASETQDAMRACDLTLELGGVLEQRLGDVRGATAAFERVLAIFPQSERAASSLARLYEADRRWSHLASLLELRGRTASGAEAAAARRRRAEILADRLGDAQTSIDELESLRAESPRDQATLRLLESLYQRLGRADDYLRILDARAAVTDDRAERIALWRRIVAEAGSAPETGWATPAPPSRRTEWTVRALENIVLADPSDGDAFLALVQLERSAGRFADLARVLSYLIGITESEETRRELLVTLGELCERELEDPVRALDAYVGAEKLGDTREELYAAIVRLAEQLGRWDLYVRTLAAWAAKADTPELAAGMYLQAARAAYEHAPEGPGAAEAHLVAAVNVAPEHPGALSALARFRRERGENAAAVDLLLAAAEREPEPKGSAALLAEAAVALRRDPAGGDTSTDARVEELCARALAIDPEQVLAARQLADLRLSRKQWREAEPLLDLLARHVSEPDREGAVALQLERAEVAIALDDEDKAIECLTAALAVAPEALPVLDRLAKLRMRRREWKAARDLDMTMLRAHRPALPAERIVALTMEIGRCQQELGNAEDALSWYRDAKALDEKHRPALEASCKLRAAKGDWAGWVADMESLAAIAEPAERPWLLAEMGDVYAEKLGDAGRAMAAYQAALQIEPDRRSVLLKIAELHMRAKEWQPALDRLSRLATLEPDAQVRAKILLTAAHIWSDELARPAEAAALLERALEEAPDPHEPFAALEKLHTKRHDWPAVVQSYQRMMKRLGDAAPPEVRAALLARVAEIAYRHMADPKQAVAALEQAAALEPHDRTRQEALADLYVTAGPDARDKAIAAHHRLLAEDTTRVASYRALARLYGEIGAIDERWCIAATLSFLRQADADLEELYRRYRPSQVPLARGRLTEEVWELVRHPHEDRLLGAVFAITGSILAAPVAQPPSRFGLRPRKRADLASDVRPAVRVAVHLADTMAVSMPELFVVEEGPPETMAVSLMDKAGPRSTLVLGPSTLRRQSFDLVFDVARYLAFMRPERFVRFALPSADAMVPAIRAVLRLAGSATGGVAGAGAGADSADVERLAAYLQAKLHAASRGQLAELTQRLRATEAGEPDVERWMRGADLSAARAGLLMCGDLRAAARVILADHLETSAVPAEQRVHDLTVFSVSPAYFACRRHLGLQVTG